MAKSYLPYLAVRMRRYGSLFKINPSDKNLPSLKKIYIVELVQLQGNLDGRLQFATAHLFSLSGPRFSKLPICLSCSKSHVVRPTITQAHSAERKENLWSNDSFISLLVAIQIKNKIKELRY